MTEKKIPKMQLDQCIEATKNYFDPNVPFSHGLLDAKIDVCLRLEESVRVGMIVFGDFLGSILTPSGLRPDATNEDIYKVLEVLGWQVTDEGKEDENESV